MRVDGGGFFSAQVFEGADRKLRAFFENEKFSFRTKTSSW